MSASVAAEPGKEMQSAPSVQFKDAGEGSAPTSSPTQQKSKVRENRRFSRAFMKVHNKSVVQARDKASKSFYRPAMNRPLLGRWMTEHAWNMNLVELVCFLAVVGLTAGTASSGLGVAINALISLVLIPRNSIITYFVGVAYERAVRYHVWVGIFMIAPICIHGFSHGFLTQWGGVELTGSIAAFIYFALLVFALPPIRRRKWEFFKWLHYINVVGFIVMAIVHKPVVGAIVAAGLILYAVDLAIRIQRHCTPAEIVAIHRTEGSDIVGLEVSTHNAMRFVPGQYAYLLIPHVSSTEWHPFSTCGDPKKDTVTFFIRTLGGWTAKAVSKIQVGDSVRLDGPYGLPAVAWTMYKELYLIAGGIGITPLMSICRGALQAVRENTPFDGVSTIHLHWTTRNPSDFLIFEEQLKLMMQNPRPDVVNFHVTLYSTQDQPDLGIPYTRGRLNAHEVLKARAILPPTQCCSGMRAAEDSVAVLACGPPQMTDSLALSSAQLSSDKLAFHYHAESFIL